MGGTEQAPDGNVDDIFPRGRLRMPTARLGQLRELLQRRAFFVGVTEHYAASLCLLKAKLMRELKSNTCLLYSHSSTCTNILVPV